MKKKEREGEEEEKNQEISCAFLGIWNIKRISLEKNIFIAEKLPVISSKYHFSLPL